MGGAFKSLAAAELTVLITDFMGLVTGQPYIALPAQINRAEKHTVF